MCLKQELCPEEAGMPYECYGYVVGVMWGKLLMPGVIGVGRYKIGKEYKARVSSRDPYCNRTYYGFHGYNSLHDLTSNHRPNQNHVAVLCSFREPMGIGIQSVSTQTVGFRYKYRTALEIVRVYQDNEYGRIWWGYRK